jgi:hypothetical protein
MKYTDYVKDVFIEHHNCMGMDLQEAEDLYNDSDFFALEKWLLKKGYNLKEDAAQ